MRSPATGPLGWEDLMEDRRPADITQALHAAAAGEPAATDRLWTLVYAELRQMAHRELFDERRGQTLSTTALVHEAYLKFADRDDVEWQNRRHFFALACRAMRRILVDHARHRDAQKRNAAQHNVSLSDSMAIAEERQEDLVALDDALTRLAAHNERLGKVVECHFFGGLSLRETADVLEINQRTAERDWRRAKVYLHRLLYPDVENV